jgi:RNA polymerase sigma factor (TIGR02999 family)
MNRVPQASVSELLLNWRQGDPDALRTLMPLVYSELRRLARYYLHQQRSDHTLQSTALVHEAYLKLVHMDMRWENRAHFFGVAAQVMRGILVDHARNRQAAKRGGGALKLSLDEAVLEPEQRDVDVIALDDALNTLATFDPRQSRIVELRFFGGLSIEETGEVLSVSPATVKREWSMARTWLHRQLCEAPG